MSRFGKTGGATGAPFPSDSKYSRKVLNMILLSVVNGWICVVSQVAEGSNTVASWRAAKSLWMRTESPQ